MITINVILRVSFIELLHIHLENTVWLVYLFKSETCKNISYWSTRLCMNFIFNDNDNGNI